MALTSIVLLWTARKALGLHCLPVSASSLPSALKFRALSPASCAPSAPCSGEVMMAPKNFAPSRVAALRAARTVFAGWASVDDFRSSTLCPSTPPFAFASLAAYSHALLASAPNTASAPLDGGMSATLSGSPDFDPPEPLEPLSSEPQAATPPTIISAASAVKILNLTPIPLSSGGLPDVTLSCHRDITQVDAREPACRPHSGVFLPPLGGQLRRRVIQRGT